jgi:CubicO group peptidase (beta-lactamase class C family)
VTAENLTSRQVQHMENWLKPALDYIPQWLEYQLREAEQPGCVLAIVHKGKVVLERAFGYADIVSREPLTARHRFRVASHSKSFTAAGVMRLREDGRLGLDDRIGQYVEGLHPEIAAATIDQLLSHSAGIARDGSDGGQWQDRRPFLSEVELRADLAAAPVIEANTRFKYSNHGYGLAGLLIEAVTGTPYRSWIRRAIIEPAGRRETEPDMPVAADVPLARGHSGKLPLGRRVVIPGDNPANGLAPATGFVSTAQDLACFFAQLDPAAKQSVLTVASRREMIRRQWRNPHAAVERYYGLGIISGNIAEWEWFGHSGAFQGFASRTAVLPECGIAVSLVCNAVDAPTDRWLEGVIRILACFAKYGAPANGVRDWAGRWWSLWGAIDLVPVGEKVMIGVPSLPNPFTDASEISVTDKDRGRISLAPGFARHGEDVRRIRGANGAVAELWLGGARFLSEPQISAELEDHYSG